MHEKYFDHAATTPVDERVLAEMLPFFNELPGNASSIHHLGKRAEAAVDLARQRVANLLGAEDPYQITFTSGATESNNWVLSRFPVDRIDASPFEHSSVRNFLSYHQCHRGESGLDLYAQVLVDNETGAVFCPAEEKESRGALEVLVDATQGFGKIAFDLEGLDFVSGSAHKIYGPKGVGFLYEANPHLTPMVVGGWQEFGRRSGTLNVPGIVGLGMAAELALEEREVNFAQATELRNIIREELDGIDDLKFNESVNQSPFILSVSVLGVEGETIVLDIDQKGFCLSAGSACSSKSTALSPLLLSFGVEPEWIRGTFRISIGKDNSRESSRELGENLRITILNLRNSKKS